MSRLWFFYAGDAVLLGLTISLAWHGGLYVWPLAMVALFNAILANCLLGEAAGDGGGA